MHIRVIAEETAIGTKRRLQGGRRPEQHRVWRKASLAPCLFIIMTIIGSALTAGSTSAQVDYPAVPVEQRADVILVLKPHTTFDLHVSSPAERIVEGDIVRLEKGVVPQTIVHTPNTMVAPLRAGVPVKLFLKAFRGRNAHYIIGVFPEWYGGQP